MVDVKVTLSFTALGNLEQIAELCGMEGAIPTAIADSASLTSFLLRQFKSGKSIILRDGVTESRVVMEKYFRNK